MNKAINDYIIKTGAKITFGDNKLVAFSDPGRCWYIVSGEVNIIAAKHNNGEIIGKRYYLNSYHKQELIIGFKDIEKNGFGIFVEPSLDVELYEINLNQLLKRLGNTDDNNLLIELINNHVEKLLNSVLNTTSGNTLKDDIVLLNNDRKELTKECNLLSTNQNIIWCKTEKRVDLIYLEQFPFENKKNDYFPISKNSLFNIYGKTNINGVSTELLLKSSERLKAFDFFNDFIVDKLFFEIKQQKIINEEWLEKKYKTRNKEFFHAIDLAKNVLDDTQEEINIQKYKKSSSDFFNVCSLVSENSDIKLTLPPDFNKSSNPISDICRYSGIRYREILLEGEWYKTMGNTSIVAFEESSGDPVAIIPKKRKLVVYNLKQNTSYNINRETYKNISKLSYILYKPLPNKKLSIKDLLSYSFFNNKKDVVRLINSFLLVTLLSFLVPIMTAVLFDNIIPNAQSSQLIYIALALLVAGIGGILFEIVKSISLLRLRGNIDSSLQAAIWDRLLEMPTEFFRKFTAGDLADRSLGITNILGALSGVVLTSIVGGIFSVFNFILLFYFSSKLALIVTGFILIYLLMVYILGKKQVILENKIQDIEGKNFGIILQLLTGITTLKVAGSEIKAFIYWFKSYITSKEYSINAQKIKNLQETVRSVFYLTVVTVVYFALIKLNTDISTGEFLAFNAALGTFIISIVSLSEGLIYLFETVPIYERLKPIFNELPENSGVKIAPKDLSGTIEFNNVSFRYTENSPLIINNVTFKIDKGEYVALVGPSGSGKSTLLRLLLGFNQANSGTITYNNQEINSIDLKLLRRQIGVVLQDGSVLGDDLFTNIIGSSPNLTLNDAWDAAKAAAFDEDIENMPMGMFTIVSEDGGTLSGGQRQRLMIARALVHKPQILVFDEATSALDNRTQAIVTESLDKLKVTRIVVAHRLSTIKNADRIVYLEGGHILEQGSYNELMKQKGKFYDLAQRQLE